MKYFNTQISIIICFLVFNITIPSTNGQYSDSVEMSSDSDIIDIESDTPSYSDFPDDTLINKTFEPNFKERYKGDKFDYTEAEQVKKPPMEMNSLLADILFFLMKVIFVLGLAFGVYAVVMFLLGQDFRTYFKRDKPIEKNIMYEGNLESIENNDFDAQIELSLSIGDYRSAVRFYFLKTLQVLNTKEIIQWHIDKTNSDYKYEIRDTKIRNSFSYLSYIYDCTWYGEIGMNASEYNLAERAFTSTLQQINHG